MTTTTTTTIIIMSTAFVKTLEARGVRSSMLPEKKLEN
jgi:hypothetical protein